MLHSFDKHITLILCSDQGSVSYKQKKRTRNNIYCNYADTFVDISKKFRDEFVECHQTENFRASKEDLRYIVMTVIGKGYKYY